MTKSQEVTCRYGITYTVTFTGNKAAIARGVELMTRCCCWVCHNLDCKEPRNEKIPECQNVCEIWTKTPYCNDKI